MPKYSFDKPIVILPHYGEFGFFIFRYIRLVHEIQAPQKIVCCEPSQKLFFPSASDFFYDWENPLSDDNRRGWSDNHHEDSIKDKSKLISIFSEKYPNHEIVDLSKYDGTIPKSVPKIKPNKLRGLKCDVVIGPRKRGRRGSKNWNHWNKLGEMLESSGISYAILGKQESSYKVPGAKYYSWTYPDEDSEVELIQSSKFYIGNNTGTAHLAALLQKPMIVIKHPKMGDDPFTKMMQDTNSQKVIKLDEPWPALWYHDPIYVHKAIVNEFSFEKEWIKETWAKSQEDQKVQLDRLAIIETELKEFHKSINEHENQND